MNLTQMPFERKLVKMHGLIPNIPLKHNEQRSNGFYGANYAKMYRLL